MSKIKKNPYGIKTPTSVEEFRDNLKKYYVTYEERGMTQLFLKERNILLHGLRSFDDITSKLDNTLMYDTIGTGRRYYTNVKSNPHICPMVTPIKPITEYMEETGQLLSSNGYFYDESNFKIWDDVTDFMKNGEPNFYTLDNQWFREFYTITLGEYSGYEMKDEKELQKQNLN